MRANHLATSGKIDLDALISHHYPLTETPAAFELNARYGDGIHKTIIDI